MIVEGLLPLHTKTARACFDITVYLDPPEEIRIAWKLRRDTKKRGYTEDEVREDLKKREPESVEFIRPQRARADIVVRFAPIEERGETADDPLSATLLLRPTISHPDLHDDPRATTREQAMHLKLTRDDDGKPVDAVHIHSYADREVTRKVEQAIWDELGVDAPVPESLGRLDADDDARDEPLALTQLVLLYHLIQAKQSGRLATEVRAGVPGAGDDPLVLVSNRGPVQYARVDGERTAERGHGGLVTALAGLAGHFDGAVWVCARARARRTSPSPGSTTGRRSTSRATGRRCGSA